MRFALLATSLFAFAPVALALGGCDGLKESPAVPGNAGPANEGGPAGDPSEPPPDDDAGSPADASRDATGPREGGGTCVPACGGRTCGKDPVCGRSCGTCGASESCDERTNGASCKASTIVWEVDGVIVVQKASAEAFYTASTGGYSLFFPYWGRNVQGYLPPNPATGTLASCPSGGAATLSLITSDNSWADLGALPARWKNLSFVSCGAQSSGDVVTAKDLTITSVSPARVAGTYEIVVQGAGPRAGSTLRVRGSFDVTPTSQ